MFFGGALIESSFLSFGGYFECACQLPLSSPQFGKGLVHLVFSPYVWLCDCWLCDPTWGGETGFPPLKSNGFFFMNGGFIGGSFFLTSSVCTSFIVAVFFGGGRIGTSPFLLTMSRVFSGGGGIGPSPRTAGLYLGGRRTGLLPHNDGDYFGGGGTGPPPHNVGKVPIRCGRDTDGTLRQYHDL